MRFAETDGEPVCPQLRLPRDLQHHASAAASSASPATTSSRVTSGTIFAIRKLSFTDLLAAIVIFVNGAKGVAALAAQPRPGRAIQDRVRSLAQAARSDGARASGPRPLNGIVEIDGAYFGGHVEAGKPQGRSQGPPPQSKPSPASASASLSCASATGRSLPFVVRNEGDAVPDRSRPRWHARDHLCRRRHGLGCASRWLGYPAASITALRSWMRAFAPIRRRAISRRLRRAEIGTHHHIAGPYLNAYADEMAWREDHRRVATAVRLRWLARAAMASRVSRAVGGILAARGLVLAGNCQEQLSGASHAFPEGCG